MVRRRGVRRWHRAALLRPLLLLLLGTAAVQVVHHRLEAFALQNKLQTTKNDRRSHDVTCRFSPGYYKISKTSLKQLSAVMTGLSALRGCVYVFSSFSQQNSLLTTTTIVC